MSTVDMMQEYRGILVDFNAAKLKCLEKKFGKFWSDVPEICGILI